MLVQKKGFTADIMPFHTQAWNTRIVVQLMNSAKGDLMLDIYGNLTSRQTYDPETFKDLPFEQHRVGSYTMALIGRDGWVLTPDGAQFIIENCPPENTNDLRILRRIADISLISLIVERRTYTGTNVGRT